MKQPLKFIILLLSLSFFPATFADFDRTGTTNTLGNFSGAGASQLNDSAQTEDKPIMIGFVQWAPVNDNKLLRNADNIAPYICRAEHGLDSYIGQRQEDGCLIPALGKTFLQKKYLILSGNQNKLQWKEASALSAYFQQENDISNHGLKTLMFKISDSPVPGGQKKNGLVFSYICRARYQSKLYFGSILPGMSNCSIPVGNTEVLAPEYETLFYR